MSAVTQSQDASQRDTEEDWERPRSDS